MYKILGADGREYGPIAADVLKQWIAQGRANGDTRVLAEGSTEWKPLREFPEFAAVLPTILPPAISTTPGAVPSPLPPDVQTRDYDLDIGYCFTRAWDLLTGPQMWLVIGGVAILILIQMGIQGLARIPILGIFIALASFVIAAPLMGGVLFFMLRCLRGDAAKIDDLFAGFRFRFGNLFLCQLIMTLIFCAVSIPGVIVVVGGALAIAAGADHSDVIVVLGIGLAGIGALVILLPSIYLSVSWAFALALVMDKHLDFWPAMETSRRVVGRHFFLVLLLLLLAGIIQMVGFCFCCIGLFFTIPLALAIKLSAYERMFSQPTTATLPKI